MNEEKNTLEPADERAAYEAPAIEQSAAFERLMLSCNMSPEEQPLGCMPTGLSAPGTGG